MVGFTSYSFQYLIPFAYFLSDSSLAEKFFGYKYDFVFSNSIFSWPWNYSIYIVIDFFSPESGCTVFAHVLVFLFSFSLFIIIISLSLPLPPQSFAHILMSVNRFGDLTQNENLKRNKVQLVQYKGCVFKFIIRYFRTI